ncbi:MAG: putative selenate reductase subunit YgfK [Deltaproteobacteria bacterium]|nr:putative selenate reductase subunit YgfK [Deltaproteobacteria bacterium]
MEKEFRPAPLGWLARWIFDDLDKRETVLGIPRPNIVEPDDRLATERFGRKLGIPLGVAAGPHTQLTQNIVAAWLCGARFIELKTVQVLDAIKVSRPCIDSEDVTYNCEWSQELSLEQSFDEYLKAWVLLHALADRLGRPGPATLFNMSVGYDLKGIQTEKVQKFVSRMRSAPQELEKAVQEVARVHPKVRDLKIPAEMTNHVTLSTMHGCPPKEIERIARYLLEELGLHTWVKLNPTLLGAERLRGILNQRNGFDITVPDAAFEHDPRFEDAIEMVANLRDAANKCGATFGVKLSNTLEVVNHRPVFPANEKMMYMSGRALHPLTVTLAHLVTEALDGSVPLSFCGGADALNFSRLIADGMAPVTVCTDLLKPGGYGRLQQYVQNLQAEMTRKGAGSLDAFIAPGQGADVGAQARKNLAEHAAAVLEEGRYAKASRRSVPKGTRKLGAYDCIAAPCQEACPAHQNIPDYLHLVANERPAAALEVILCTNPMPSVTGRVCDHPCTERCIRNHYDAPLAIREIKRFAAANAGSRSIPPVVEQPGMPRTAIIGAGPAGLSAAYYLRLAGMPVAVFDARKDAGGMANRVIPEYRLGAGAIRVDVDRVQALGAEVHLGKRVTVRELRGQGFSNFVVAVGAQTGRKLEIPGEDAKGVFDSLEFLDAVRSHERVEIGSRVLVVGGGNSAMDAARTARRLAGSGAVTVVYRRLREHMPADPDEIEECVHEGIEIRDLLAPVEVARDGQGRVTGLVCNKMKLGERDVSGRPRPVPIDGAIETIACDSILVAISQESQLDCLDGIEVERLRDGTLRVDANGQTSIPGIWAGGDVSRGPATVIKAIADGRTIAASIARAQGLALPGEPVLDKQIAPAAALDKKSRKVLPAAFPVLALDKRGSFEEVAPTLTAELAVAEANRCLDCDEVCSLCVTVCPNRANQAWFTPLMTLQLPSLVVRDGRLETDSDDRFRLRQPIQIINVADFCNECGNCTTFCPTAGAPYRDKPRLHLDREGFDKAPYDAFVFDGTRQTPSLVARIAGAVYKVSRSGDDFEVRTDQLTAKWSASNGSFQGASLAKPGREGERFDLRQLVSLLPLLHAADILP